MGLWHSCIGCANECGAQCGPPEDACDDGGGDPAGATFEELLESLSSNDRNLLLFCAASNLSAVRWLLQLGAQWDARDGNDTTCLHVACRAGALAIVKDLVAHAELLQAEDSAGWTPLHVATCMGRTDVVRQLLEAGAPALARNHRGQTPLELCSHAETYEVLLRFQTGLPQLPASPGSSNQEACSPREGTASRGQMIYEPYFVPRHPVVSLPQHKQQFMRMGALMFNRQPGCGMAFLVASGAVRDYPVDLSKFISRNVDPKKVWSFLGEPWSVCSTLRLEHMNQMNLLNTGVISALKLIFGSCWLPADLQKINCLVFSASRIWWRQHERLEARRKDRCEATELELGKTHLRAELTGLNLKASIPSMDALHQVMFSAVLLHMFMYKNGSAAKQVMDYDTFRYVSCVVEDNGHPVSQVLQQVYALVNNAFIPELAFAEDDANEDECASSLQSFAAVQGWTKVVATREGPTGVQAITSQHVSNIFSELAGSTEQSSNVAAAERSMNDFVWLTLCCPLLFFSATDHAGAPYAFINLRRVLITSVDEEAHVITIAGKGSSEPDEDATSPPVIVVLLLPDGRWHELDFEQLELRLPPSPVEFRSWLFHLNQSITLEDESVRKGEDVDSKWWKQTPAAALPGAEARRGGA